MKAASKTPKKRTSPKPKSAQGFRHPPKPLRAALYARVSTSDQQTLPMQMKALRGYANQREWHIVEEVRDVGSGALARPKREMLMKAARRKEIDVVLVWRLDRWGRSVADLALTMKELHQLGRHRPQSTARKFNGCLPRGSAKPKSRGGSNWRGARCGFT